eukprot:3786408-Alexandrium_andersonii.AAC.1
MVWACALSCLCCAAPSAPRNAQHTPQHTLFSKDAPGLAAGAASPGPGGPWGRWIAAGAANGKRLPANQAKLSNFAPKRPAKQRQQPKVCTLVFLAADEANGAGPGESRVYKLLGVPYLLS